MNETRSLPPTLSFDEGGDAFLRARTLLPRTCERHLYGALLDAWHSDLECIGQAPAWTRR